MARYQCSVCGYVYDEQQEGKRWDELPDDWTCPICGASKAEFERDSDKPDTLDTGDSATSDREVPGASPLFPKSFATAHRVFGYIFLGAYLLLLFQMVPRLWTYQIELPARTVVHLSLGMAVGVVLLLKIAIVRYFRRLESSLVPSLGTFLLVASVVLVGISVPSAFREAWAAHRLFTPENRERVRVLLVRTGVGEPEAKRLASASSLRGGQRVLRQECTECHDLRSVLAKPRTPRSWRQTVRRMAERTVLLNELSEQEQWQVTAYLVALSPVLQRSSQQAGIEHANREKTRHALEAAGKQASVTAYNAADAKQLFEAKCAQCHDTSLVESSPPRSDREARELVTKMVGEGLTATRQELALLIRYLTETYAKPSE